MTDNYCWSCGTEKDSINKTTGEFYSGICHDCTSELEGLLKKYNAELIQNDRKPFYSGWHGGEVTVRDVFVKLGNEVYAIQGFYTCDEPYDTTKAFDLTKQFIDNGFKYISYYGDFEKLKEYDYWFDIAKQGQFYTFGGNCHKYSNAFSMKTLDINQIWNYTDKWNEIPDKLKAHIKEQVDKGLIFCNTLEAHQEDKAYCFKDYSDFEETKQAKVIKLSGFEGKTEAV